MKYRILVSVLILAANTHLMADEAAETCNALLDHGIQNTQTASAEYDYLAALSDEYCQSDYSAMNATKSASFSAAVKTVPVSLTGAATDTKTKHSNFCRDFKSLAVNKSSQFSKTTNIFQGALDAWNRCQLLASKTLIIQPSFTADRKSVSFAMSTPSSANYVFTGVDTTNMKCSIRGKNVGPSEKRQLTSTATVMNCLREGSRMKLHNQEVEYFPSGNVNLKTGEGNTLVEFGEMIDFAGRDKFAQIDAELAATKHSLEAFIASFSSLKGSAQDSSVSSPDNSPGDWTAFATCPAGTYVSGVSTFDRDTGSKCMPCISHVRVTCTAFPK